MPADPRHNETPGALEHFGLAETSDRWLEILAEAQHGQRLGTIGGYELIDEIGRGGQGTVYRARAHNEHGQARGDVAIKIVRTRGDVSSDRLDRFECECEAVARLDHPSIAKLIETVREPNASCIVMELIDGPPITDACAAMRGSTDGIRDIARLFAQICDALHHAHQRGVIHRDIKPANVLVDERNGAHRPVILDFGMADVRIDPEAAHATEQELTLTEKLGLTPTYASPEQARGYSAIDIRTDAYSLGMLLFRCLTGKLPYPSDDPNLLRTLEHICSTAPSRASGFNTLVPKTLDAIVRKSLEKNPANRYQSLEAFASDLRAFCDGLPVSAASPSVLASLRRAVREQRTAMSLAATLALTVCIAAIVSGTRVPNKRRAPPRGDGAASHKRAESSLARFARGGDRVTRRAERNAP